MNKISKIVLPLATLTTATAAITPLVACGNNSIDLLDYSPDPRTKHVKDSLYPSEATDALFGQNNSIYLVKQDILTYLSWELNNELEAALILAGVDWVGRVKSATASLSNLELEYNSNTHIANLSGKIVLKADCTMLRDDDKTQIIGSYSLETQHELHHVPYKMVHDEQWYEPYWTSYFSKEQLIEDTTWSVDLWYKGSAKYTIAHDDEEVEESVVYNNSTISTQQDLFDSLTLIRWWSYHLWDVDEKTSI